MKETHGSLWKTTRLRVVRTEDIRHPDESSVMVNGSAFTGIHVEEDSPSVSYHGPWSGEGTMGLVTIVAPTEHWPNMGITMEAWTGGRPKSGTNTGN